MWRRHDGALEGGKEWQPWGWREKKKEREGWIRRNGWWCGPV